MATDGFNFEKNINALKKAQIDLPLVLANEGQRFFLNSFNKQQWEGKSWDARKDSNNTHKLLVATGNLKSAVADCIRSYDWEKIYWSIGVDYAKYHNSGATGTGRGRNGVIPQRQFFGKSNDLIDKMKRKITLAMKDIF